MSGLALDRRHQAERAARLAETAWQGDGDDLLHPVLHLQPAALEWREALWFAWGAAITGVLVCVAIAGRAEGWW